MNRQSILRTLRSWGSIPFKRTTLGIPYRYISLLSRTPSTHQRTITRGLQSQKVPSNLCGLYKVHSIEDIRSSTSCHFNFSTTTTSTPQDLTTKSDVGMVHVTIEEATEMTKKALCQIGWDDYSAQVQADIMVSAELCGNNQGLVKMYQPHLMAPSSPSTSNRPIITRETAISAVIDAQQSPGMIAAITASDLVVQKVVTSKLPIAIVCTHNTSTSSGQLAHYVERIAQNHNMIGIAMCNSPEFVAAAPGAKPVFGTNPIAISIPLSDSPFPYTFDMATSAIALFGVLSAKAKGEPLPPNVAYGKDGTYTTDASEVLDGGAIATFGGHKGLGLSLCVELLAGALSGSAVLGEVESKKIAKSWGHTFIAIQPDALTDHFSRKAASVIATVKASGMSVRIPGERSSQMAIHRREVGLMPIPERIWESIVHTAEHGLKSKST